MVELKIYEATVVTIPLVLGIVFLSLIFLVLLVALVRSIKRNDTLLDKTRNSKKRDGIEGFIDLTETKSSLRKNCREINCQILQRDKLRNSLIKKLEKLSSLSWSQPLYHLDEKSVVVLRINKAALEFEISKISQQVNEFDLAIVKNLKKICEFAEEYELKDYVKWDFSYESFMVSVKCDYFQTNRLISRIQFLLRKPDGSKVPAPLSALDVVKNFMKIFIE